jgi:hypothetical protein
MELLLTSKASNSLTHYENDIVITDPKGLLNSNYQNVVESTLRINSSTSIFGIRQQMKVKRFQMVSNAETLLKLSIFTIVILMMFN